MITDLQNNWLCWLSYAGINTEGGNLLPPPPPQKKKKLENYIIIIIVRKQTIISPVLNSHTVPQGKYSVSFHGM